MRFKALPAIEEPFSHWIRAWAPVVLYAGLIFYLSSRPVPEIVPAFRFSDKILHLLEYGVFGVLTAYALRTSPRKAASPKMEFVLGVAIVAIYGLSDEFHQFFLPFRDASLYDVVADIIGGTLGIFALGKIKIKGDNTHD
jgi:VanZ family protein